MTDDESPAQRLDAARARIAAGELEVEAGRFDLNAAYHAYALTGLSYEQIAALASVSKQTVSNAVASYRRVTGWKPLPAVRSRTFEPSLTSQPVVAGPYGYRVAPTPVEAEEARAREAMWLATKALEEVAGADETDDEPELNPSVDEVDF